MPKNSPKIIIPEICTAKKIPEPIKTILLFKFPKNSEIYIKLIVMGIIAKLIILTTSIVSTNFGKNVLIRTGEIINDIIAIIIETIIVNCFNFESCSPLESRGRVY